MPLKNESMCPFSFDEFLLAMNEKLLLQANHNASVQNPLNEVMHQKLLNCLKRFLILGGMPEVSQTNYQ
jgi:predicted AAA+ superfamily ATPase